MNIQIEQREYKFNKYNQSFFLLGLLSCYEEVDFDIKTTEDTNEEYIFLTSIGIGKNQILWNDIVRLNPYDIPTENIASYMNDYLFDILQIYGYQLQCITVNNNDYILSLYINDHLLFDNHSIQFIGSLLNKYFTSHYGTSLPIRLNKYSTIIHRLFSSIISLNQLT